MQMGLPFKPDEIGEWSRIKLEIIREYANAYTKILAAQSYLKHIYIDGFAGAGVHVDRDTKALIAGTPMNVLSIVPRFREYHFVELNPAKVAHLRQMASGVTAATVHEGDCNSVLTNKVLPTVQYRDYRRAFCLLDPYGLQLSWSVVAAAGALGTVDVLINFPIMDMNRNALWRNPEGVTPEDAARMTTFWGDESWRTAAYAEEPTLFGVESRKRDNEAVVDAFLARVQSHAGFKHVARPLPMKNTAGATVYYLVFASAKANAVGIMNDIFKKPRDGG